MTEQEATSSFLSALGWSNAVQTPLAGDASARRYKRLSQNGETAILMIAPPQTCGPLEPFISIAAHLKVNGLRAPDIFGADQAAGLMLLEDFGDNLLASLASTSPDLAADLYKSATQVLVKLQGAEWPKGMTATTPETLADMTRLVFDHYAPNVSKAAQDEATGALLAHLKALPELPQTLSLRDYHAENIVWLGQDAIGTDAMGLLDFQDAFITHPAYDLASLCQDARRDVSATIETACIETFLAGTHLHKSDFLSGYFAIGLQRNLRILGVFCRLATERHKPQYLTLLPRVWSHVQKTLARPDMANLKRAYACLPAPEEL